jgi:hypothetical protein
MKATTLAIAVSILASAGLAAVAVYDMTAWNRARAKDVAMQKDPQMTQAPGEGGDPAKARP